MVTAQHVKQLDQVLETFRIQTDYDLDIMGKNQFLLDITAETSEKFDPVSERSGNQIWFGPWDNDDLQPVLLLL